VSDAEFAASPPREATRVMDRSVMEYLFGGRTLDEAVAACVAALGPRPTLHVSLRDPSPQVQARLTAFQDVLQRLRAGEDCDAILAQLRAGDFSQLAAVMTSQNGAIPRIVQMHRDGDFAKHEEELAEALSCAAFLGASEALEYLLAAGVRSDGGSRTGLNALHWAANRGELAAVQRLVRAGAALETRNAYGGTVLGATVWAAIHEPRPAHVAVIEVLLEAGADVREAAYPSGNAAVDAVLAKFGARAQS